MKGELLSIETAEKIARINKAIELLNKLDFDNFVYTKQSLKNIKRDLLNILQGSDRDE